MDITTMLVVLISVIGAIALVGFFWTKAAGYGKYTTSTLILLVIAILAALLFASGKLEGQVLSNIFLAVAGFAGGLVAAGKES